MVFSFALDPFSVSQTFKGRNMMMYLLVKNRVWGVILEAAQFRFALADKHQDPLQFCANFFNDRLASERSAHLAQQPPHSSSSGMSSGGIHSVAEEDEHIASPTSASFPSNARALPTMSSSSPFGGFAGFDPTGHAKNVASDDPTPLPNNYNLNRRTSVSAESLTPTSANNDNWTPPNHPKAPEQIDRLRKAVSTNFLFAHLAEEQATQVLGALQEKPIPKPGMRVITQGDVGDYFYVVESGDFDIYVNPSGQLEPGPDGMGNKVANVGTGGSFGELALMYNAPRAATVVSTQPSTLWALDRVTFRRILMDAAFARRRMYEGFLAEVPLLESLESYERSKIADALETIKYPAGSSVISQGEKGEDFFILEAGTAEVYKEGDPTCLKTYTKGDYFGELALLNDAPRAASVIAKTDVKVAKLGKDGFTRLLGNLEGIMRRNDYNTAGTVDPLHKA
ncbi:camp-dependent protein kinase regulatory subunit [Microthyrium microscopicum]|uniref:cAMP-dependent protein kinase regulatory subunit n=1 Tax=Microthyrium microscopicum TaxID=703497 RepID=A0A6A6U0T4_9PEZI|nr:camp-dependent protein kinase regulatory subunit [Microthyrium microscopicum]